MTYVSPFEEIQKIATKIKNKASGFVTKTVVPAVSKAASSFYDNKGYFQQGRFTTQPINQAVGNQIKWSMQNQGITNPQQFFQKAAQIPTATLQTAYQTAKPLAIPYAQNRIINPAKRVLSNLQETVAPNRSLGQRALSAGMAGLSGLETSFGMTTGGLPWFLKDAYQNAAVAKREGKPVLNALGKGFTGQEYKSLGEAVSPNKNVQATVNIAELATVFGPGVYRMGKGALNVLKSRMMGTPAINASVWDESVQRWKTSEGTIEEIDMARTAITNVANRMLGQEKTKNIIKKFGYDRLIDIVNNKLAKKVNYYEGEGYRKGFVENSKTPQPQGVIPSKGIFKNVTEMENYDNFFSNKPFEGAGNYKTISEYQRAKTGKTAKIVEMTPDEYLSQITTAPPNKKSIEFMKKKLAKGEQLPMPSLDFTYSPLSQEGRNRAYLAKELGIEKIPVAVIEKPSPQGVISKASSLSTSTNQNTNPAIVQNQLGKARQKPVLTQNSIVPGQGTESTVATGVSSSTSDYIKELTDKQNKAGSSGPVRGGLIGKIKNFMSEVKEKFVDSTAPIEDAVTLAEKKGKYKVLPREDVRLQIDKVLRSKTLASQFAEDNGLVQAIKDAPDINALDQYMIAKQSQRVEQLGIKTGRNLQRDQQLINDLAPIYEPIAKKVNEYSRRLLQYSVDSGLISKDLANELIKKYPDYVPLQRVFNELEKGTVRNFNPRGVASLSKQTVVQRLQGSEREIASPTESLLLKTQDAFNQGERNKAGRMLAQMSKLKEFNTLIKEVTNGTVPKNSFSYIENGVKRTFETTPEIAAAAKSLNSEQMGLLGKIFSIPTRILQLGATGLNLPFVVTNIAKDQITSFINSNKTAQTSLLNPLNFLRALTSAVKHDNLYKEVIREGAGGTSFDIARNTPNLTIDKIRAGRSVASKISYTVRHPEELIRAVENIIGRGEELGRIQNYKGSKQAFLGEGRTVQDATLLAAEQARKNTANFARRGSWGKTLNYLIPFFNAGIQGARQLVTSFARNPKETTAKVTVALFMPVTAATLWNTSEPDRKLAYDDISKYEKESNIILIPPNPTKDDKGRWNVIKIPIPPGLSNLTSLVRRPLEQMQGLDPVKFSEMAGNIITASTSIDVTSPNKLLSSFTPQLLKPGIESSLNKNLYTGRDIVPTSLQNLPPAEQFKPTTSGTARKIGMLTNISPLKIENAVRTSAGGVGSQLLNISDQVLAKSGIIPEDQIGGENPIENINRRFSKAYGGNIEDRQYSQLDPYRADDIRNRIESKGAVEKLSKKLDSLSPVERKNYLVNAIKSGELDKEGIKKLISYKQEQALGRTSIEDSLIRLTVKSRAKYIKDQMKGLSPESKKALLLNYAKKKILTKDVLKEIINSN